MFVLTNSEINIFCKFLYFSVSKKEDIQKLWFTDIQKIESIANKDCIIF